MKKKIAVSNPSFEEIRKKNCIYVDKTKYIYNLVRDDVNYYYFISRPRRYGKSLMCSTLHALFDGKRELFKDLYIDKTDYSFERYPVFHFNMALLSKVSYEAFLNDFQIAIMDEAESNGIKVDRSEPSTMLNYILKVAKKEVVIIVDEYDEPIIHTYKDKEKADKIRESFSQFYTVIKNRSEKIRFFFITGITKFSNMSIFSQMNNLIDLTFSDTTAAMFGYTEEELLSYFSVYIDEYMNRDDRRYEKREDFLSAVREYYDGYRFSYECDEKVYNPVSIGFFFNDDCSFKNYWINTGVSTLAVDLAREYELESVIYEEMKLDMNSVSNFDYLELAAHRLSSQQILALLYFTGYLTIKEGNDNVLTLALPNTEVRTSFAQNLVNRYSGISVGIYVDSANKALKKNDINRLMKVLNAYYKEHPYTLLEKEKSYQLAFYSFFVMLGGIAVNAEETTLLGRSDIVLSCQKDVYVIEMKVDDTSFNALKQIKNMRYHEKYVNTDKTIHLIGMSFSSKSREIDDFIEEIVDKTKEPNYLG